MAASQGQQTQAKSLNPPSYLPLFTSLGLQRAIARVMRLINGVSHGGLWLKGELIPLGRLHPRRALLPVGVGATPF